MVRPIDDKDLTKLNFALHILKEVGEQIDDQLFADQVSCLWCMIRGKQSVSVLKLMMLSAPSSEDCEITEERAKVLSAARASRHALQAFVENPSRLHQQSAPLADWHLKVFETQFADKSIIDNTFQDIDHVIKDVERKWRGDILQLQAKVASSCPAWELKAEDLLTDVAAQTALLENAECLQLGPSVVRLSSMREQLAKMQSDTFGFVLSPADSKSIADTTRLASRTVCVIYALYKLRQSLPQCDGEAPASRGGKGLPTGISSQESNIACILAEAP